MKDVTVRGAAGHSQPLTTKLYQPQSAQFRTLWLAWQGKNMRYAAGIATAHDWSRQ